MKIGWALDMIGWACAQPFPTLATPLSASISDGVWLSWRMPRLRVAWGSGRNWAGIFTTFKSFYVIVKIVTPCFRRPSLLSRSLVGTLAWL